MSRFPFRSLFLLPAVLGLAWTAPAAWAQSALRSGDTVDVRVAGIPAEEMQQFSASYTIDENGMINLPYIGLTKAVGLQPNAVQRVIEEKLKSEKIFTNPTITVSAQNSARFVNLGGAGVRSPGRIPYTADLTLMSAINAGGGFNDFADRKKVRLIRSGKAFIFDTRDIAKDPSKDPAVKPGDQIEVPMSMGILWW